MSYGVLTYMYMKNGDTMTLNNNILIFGCIWYVQEVERQLSHQYWFVGSGEWLKTLHCIWQRK